MAVDRIVGKLGASRHQLPDSFPGCPFQGLQGWSVPAVAALLKQVVVEFAEACAFEVAAGIVYHCIQVTSAGFAQAMADDGGQ